MTNYNVLKSQMTVCHHYSIVSAKPYILVALAIRKNVVVSDGNGLGCEAYNYSADKVK